MSSPTLLPQIIDHNTATGRWMVTIYNNDTTTVEDVIFILITATGCNQQEAEIETWEAHHFGKAPVHFASKAECEQAASIISAIGVKTEVTPEWDD